MKKYLLFFLINCHAFGACSSAFAQSKWNPLNWFKDPVISHDYTKADYDQNPQSQKMVFRSQNQELIVIDEGRIFRKSRDTGFEWHYIKETSLVQAILLYRKSLIALRNNGDVFLLVEQENKEEEWFEIGNSARKILATDQDLFALVKDQLWIYQGAPGEEILTFTMIPMTTYINNMPVTNFIMTPMSGGRKVAFQKSSVKDLSDIALDLENQDVKLTWTSGAIAHYYKDLQPE